MTSRSLVTGPIKGASAGRAKDGQGRTIDLARLVERVARGDRIAFERLYGRTVGTVHALVRTVLTEDTASATVTAEVYARVWSEAHTYEQDLHTAESWILGLAHRCAVERRRADSMSPAREPILPALTGSATHVGRAIDLLTPEQAEALGLAYLGGATHAESARSLGVDRATFRIRVGTALSRLRQELDSGRQPGRPPRATLHS